MISSLSSLSQDANLNLKVKSLTGVSDYKGRTDAQTMAKELGVQALLFGRVVKGSDGTSLYWEGLQKGKRSVAVDLSRPEGRQIAVDLITAPGRDAGVFVTNYPQEGFLGHAALRKHRDDLITVRVLGWRDGGPGVDALLPNPGCESQNSVP